MKALSGVLALAAAAVLFVPAARADAAFSDQLCPEATKSVVALGTMSQTDPPQRQYDALHAATAAYDTCAQRKLGDAKTEPDLHYAYTREASFGIVEARALLALNRPSDAKRVLENSKRLAQDVFDWRRSVSQNGSVIASSGTDNRPSIYHDAAADIVAAANDMLAKLAASQATGAASPAPSPHG
ncbi:MAG TPA: hypothetical protein VIW69_13300 [Candidatus Elarobacter sp.]